MCILPSNSAFATTATATAPRKIVASFFISLDGVVESPQTWHFPYLNDEMADVIGARIAEADTMLLGRATYEEFAAYWAGRTSADTDFADEINETPKYVVSRTLEEATWRNSTLIDSDVATRLDALKHEPGRTIGITGSATLVESLLHEGLLDELRLLVHPIVVGRGRRLFTERGGTRPLELVESNAFTNGVLDLTYVPASAG